MSRGHLRFVVCGAGPAADVGQLIEAAHERSWSTAVTATAGGACFIDVAEIEALTGHPVRTAFQARTGARVMPSVDAVIVAPATYNTINKLALGVADTYPLTSLAELIGRGIPTVVVPFVNTALAARTPFRHSIAALRAEGVRILSGPDDGWEPHPPGAGADRRAAFPWRTALQIAEGMIESRVRQ